MQSFGATMAGALVVELQPALDALALLSLKLLLAASVAGILVEVGLVVWTLGAAAVLLGLVGQVLWALVAFVLVEVLLVLGASMATVVSPLILFFLTLMTFFIIEIECLGAFVALLVVEEFFPDAGVAFAFVEKGLFLRTLVAEGVVKVGNILRAGLARLGFVPVVLPHWTPLADGAILIRGLVGTEAAVARFGDQRLVLRAFVATGL